MMADPTPRVPIKAGSDSICLEELGEVSQKCHLNCPLKNEEEFSPSREKKEELFRPRSVIGQGKGESRSGWGETGRRSWAPRLGPDCVWHAGCGLGPQPLGSWESMMNDAWVCLQRNTTNRNAGNRMRRLLRAPCKQRNKLGLRYLRWKVGWCEDIPELESVGCGEGSDRRKDGAGAKRTPKSLRCTPWGWGVMVLEARRLGGETAWREGEGKDSAHSSDTQWAPDMLSLGPVEGLQEELKGFQH